MNRPRDHGNQYVFSRISGGGFPAGAGLPRDIRHAISVTRCSDNFGPYQYPEKIIPLFITHLFDGKKMPLYGDGLNVQDRLHLTDHCEGLLRVLEDGRPGQVYNIGGINERSNLELTRTILHLLGLDEDMIQLGGRSPEARPEVCHRRLQAPQRARLGASPLRLARRAGANDRVVPGQRGLVAATQRQRLQRHDAFRPGSVPGFPGGAPVRPAIRDGKRQLATTVRALPSTSGRPVVPDAERAQRAPPGASRGSADGNTYQQQFFTAHCPTQKMPANSSSHDILMPRSLQARTWSTP